MKNLLLYLILFCSTNIASAFVVDNINYIPFGNNNVMVISGSFSSPTSVTIPSTVSDGTTTYTVTIINNGAFYNNSNLTSITLPTSITSINGSAFEGCSNLTSITIPYSTTSISIGGNAFQSCTSLSSVTFPNNVTSIGDYAFQYCSSLTSVTLPDSLTSIGMGLFQSCSSLTNFIIPSTVTSIEQSAFQSCTSLTSITIPSSVTSIGSGAFQFSGLTSVTLPNSFTSIGPGAFQFCFGLTSVTLPNSLTSIGNSAFRNCTSLTSITLPSSLTSIGTNAFYRCTSLTSISLPSGLTTIGSTTFSDCSSLTSIILPSSLTSIETGAFQYCTSLTSISLPSSVTSIGFYAFNGCTGLTSITIPSSLTTINYYAFYNCTGLTSFAINAVTPLTINPNVFTFVTLGSVNLYVPAASKTDYKSASVWSGFKFPPYITSPGSSTESTSSLSMNENSASVTTFTADEAVTWSLGASHDEGLFSIDSSGVLVFNAAPDYESTLHSNTYIVQVIATAINSVTTSQQLTITITDVAENLSPAVLSNFDSFTVSSSTSDFTINAPTSNSSGAITYTSSNPAVATITGTTVHLVGPGTTTITATQAADGSHSGNSISTTMRVSALCGDWGYSLTYPTPVTIAGAVWTSATTGTLNGVSFTLTNSSSSGDTTWDLTTSQFSVAPLSATQSMVDYGTGDDWTVTFASPITNLKLYCKWWRDADYLFDQPFSILSGATGLSNVGNTLTVSGGWGNGILEFTGSITTLTVNSDWIGGSTQIMTFGY